MPRVALLLFLAALPLHAQIPTFDVATIRPSATDAVGDNFSLSASRFSVNNAPLTDLIQFAYNLKTNQQVPKSPPWIASEKFDVDATIAPADMQALNKLPADQKLEQYRLRVRSLLVDRFNLKVSHQMKDLPVYALVLAKGGPKPALAPAPAATLATRTPTLGGFGSGQVKAGAVSMSVLADWFSGRPDVDNRPVIDATGLRGSFDFTLQWTPFAQQASDPASISLLTALQEQLGLKLEPSHAPIEILVIDHIDKPSPN